MKKVLLIVLASLLVLCAAACGSPSEKSSGLLSQNEITELEAQYGANQAELAEALGLPESSFILDVDESERFQVMTLVEGREIFDKTFTPYFFISNGPEGFYAVCYQLRLDDSSEPIGYALFDSICEEANDLYGEPRTPPYSDTPDTYRGANWRVGETSFFRVMAIDAEMVELTYQMIVPGSIYDY